MRNQEETARRFSTTPHPLYGGSALHARMMDGGILDQRGESLVPRHLQTDPAPFLKAMAPSRQGRVGAVACRCTWDGLAALGADDGRPCVRGPARSMTARHGGTATHATIDAHTLAAWLRGGRLPPASVSPATRRATRDGLRRRRPLAPHRAARLAHVPHTHRPAPLPALGHTIAAKAHRAGGAARVAAAAVPNRRAVALARLTADAARRRDGARPRVTTAPPPDATTGSRRPTVPGSGTLRRRGLREDSHAGHRCPRGQDGGASGRLGHCPRAAAGTRDGPAGATIGQAHRPWAWADAAVVCLRAPPAAPPSLALLETNQATGHAVPRLTQPLARAVEARRTRQDACEREQCGHRPTRREGSGGAYGLPGPHGDAPHRGARHGGMPGVRARQGASRAPGPAPRAVRGPPRSRRFATARVANGLRGLLRTRA